MKEITTIDPFNKVEQIYIEDSLSTLCVVEHHNKQ